MRVAAALMLAGSVAAWAHDPVTTPLTWSQEISRILKQRCLSCHSEGGRAMSLARYEEVRAWAKAIRDEVLQRRMPPWGAVKGYGDLKHDQSLTQDEIMRIAEWVEGGAPEGDPAYAPAPGAAAPAPKLDATHLRRWRGSAVASTVTVHAIRPLDNVVDSKIRAEMPDGAVEPLIWLQNYKSGWGRTFELRKPVRLPTGTRIIAEPAARFELLIAPAAGKRPRRAARSSARPPAAHSHSASTGPAH